MESRFLKDALFGGMTANSFKLGTVLSLGWFWMRPAGCHTVYRGQDGNIDYDNIQAVMDLGDSQVSIANQNLPADTLWHYVRRQVSDCGLESEDSPACVVVVDSAGVMIGKTPNPPLNLTIERLSNGRFKLRWRYTKLNEEVTPTGFRIYIDSGSGFDFASPIATVSYRLSSGVEFSWTSDPLTHDQEYRFCVRSYREELGPDLVKNGTFDNSNYWTWGDQWEWLSPGGNGKAIWEENGGWGELEQDIGVIAGHTYLTVYDFEAPESDGKCKIEVGGTQGTLRSVADTYTEILTAVDDGNLKFIAFAANGGTSYFELDDVSVKEVLSPESESCNTDFVAAVADSEGPDAITGLHSQWEQT